MRKGTSTSGQVEFKKKVHLTSETVRASMSILFFKVIKYKEDSSTKIRCTVREMVCSL